MVIVVFYIRICSSLVLVERCIVLSYSVFQLEVTVFSGHADMQSSLTASVVPHRCMRMRLEEDPNFTWRAEQAVRLSVPWPPSRARVVGRPSVHDHWRARFIQLIEIMDRSVETLGPDPAVWWRRGQPMQLTLATVAEHADVHDDVMTVAAVDEPTSAGAAPHVKWRQTHVPLEVKEWFCSLVRVKRDWSLAQCFRFAFRALPDIFTVIHVETHRRWLATKTARLPGASSCSFLGRCGVARLRQSVLWRWSCVRARECTPRTLGVDDRFSIRGSRKFMRSLGYSFKKPKGKLEGVARSNETDTPRIAPTEDGVDIERCCGNHPTQPHHQHR